MAAPYHLIESKLEDAMAAMLATAIPANIADLTVYKGYAGGEITIPALLLTIESAEPEVVGEDITGNWTCEFTATVVTSSDDTTRAIHEGYAAEIRDVLVGTSGLVALLNAEAITDLTVYRWVPGECRRLVDDDKRRTEQDGMIYAAASTIA